MAKGQVVAAKDYSSELNFEFLPQIFSCWFSVLESVLDFKIFFFNRLMISRSVGNTYRAEDNTVIFY